MPLLLLLVFFPTGPLLSLLPNSCGVSIIGVGIKPPLNKKLVPGVLLSSEMRLLARSKPRLEALSLMPLDEFGAGVAVGANVDARPDVDWGCRWDVGTGWRTCAGFRGRVEVGDRGAGAGDGAGAGAGAGAADMDAERP